ncbi:hypothetical protein [Ornithobacterium rhinotracheale]
MKNLYYFLFILFGFLSVFAQKRDTRTFQQIGDSIVREADLLYRYDRAFFRTNDSINYLRSLLKNAGEILCYQRNDSIIALITDAKIPNKVLASFDFAYAEDAPNINLHERYMNAEESNFLDMKHKIMAQVQNNYDIAQMEKGQYYNPVFIPFKEKIKGVPMQLYKLYLLTENQERNHIPFGQDYLFYANPEGKVIYNLQFNTFNPVPVTQEIVDKSLVALAYPEREPYLLPTDVMLFKKYGRFFKLNTLKVKSTAYDVWFVYTDDRSTVDVVME